MLIRTFLLFSIAVLAHVSTCMGEEKRSPAATPLAKLNLDTQAGDDLVAEYFRAQTAEIAAQTFADITTLEDWTRRREVYRSQLFDMLGLAPLPERTPLSPVVTGTATADDVVVEKIHFQSMPGLYVTANLYRPAKQDGPLPAILYVCGHGVVKKDGISYGNKTYYQHHGAWFARNGYVCLSVDTIQLGEIEGIHHGTYSKGQWWWNNRGYTPAGVEAWNCIRSLDYLQSRSEVDPERLGVTGRSGGGATSWWIAALDERIKAAVPVAGITSLQNHIVDGCVEGHCDCMYMVNTFRWDYAKVAALVAPRPLLISNTDDDRIFPLEGVVDVHSKVRDIYRLYGQGKNLGLHITQGPHTDTQELRIHAFRWMNRFLRNDSSLIEHPAKPLFSVEELKVFASLPTDERVTNIHESFVPKFESKHERANREEMLAQREQWMHSLRSHTFGSWPTENVEGLDVKVQAEAEVDSLKISAIDFTSQSPYRLTMLAVVPKAADSTKPLNVVVLDQAGWERVAPGLAVGLPNSFVGVTPDRQQWEALTTELADSPTVYIVPRGVGPTEWTRDAKERTHIRRRFMLLGQTAATTQIYDVVRGLQAIDTLAPFTERSIELRAQGEEASAWALYASLFHEPIVRIALTDLPLRNRNAPDLLNVSKFVEMPQLVLMAAERVEELQLLGSESPWRNEFPDPKGEKLKIAFPDAASN